MMRISALSCALVLLSFGERAVASPIVRVGDNRPTTWNQAITAGNITPVASALTGPTTSFYQSQVTLNGLNGFEQHVPVLTPDFPVSDGSTTRSSMVMSWSQPTDPNTLGVSSWEFTYHADPDLSGLVLDFEALAPQGVFAIGVELIDVNGHAKGWYRPLPMGTPREWDPSYVINVSGALQPPFTQFIADPGFDLTQVMKIRLNEASLPRDPFLVPDPTGRGQAWNAWAHLDVVPEPSTLVAVMLGAGGLLARRRSKAKASENRRSA